MAIIRDATIADADAIAAVHVASWQAGYRGIFPDHYLDQLRVADRIDWWRARLAEPRTTGQHLVVLESAPGHIDGFGFVCPSDEDPAGTGELAQLYFHPDAWGTGGADQLHHVLLDRLRGDDYQQAILHVAAANARARRFYERAGWTTEGVEHHEVVWGLESITLEYRIALISPRA